MDRSANVNRIGAGALASASVGGVMDQQLRLRCLEIAQHLVPAERIESASGRADDVVAAARKLEEFIFGTRSTEPAPTQEEASTPRRTPPHQPLA